MLSFVDQSANVKVFRVSHEPNGQVVRERLGLVRKKDYSLDEHLTALPTEDKSEIGSMVEFYKQGAEYETLAALYTMPCTLRKVVEHVVADGSKFERDMLMMSLIEALRLLRKSDRAEIDQG